MKEIDDLSGEAIGLSTSWQNTRLSQDQCINRAEVAMINSSFSNIEFAGESVFGYHGEYTGSIRCVASKKIIFFVVAGPSSDRAVNLRQSLVDNF